MSDEKKKSTKKKSATKKSATKKSATSAAATEPKQARETKTNAILALLRRAKGATVAEIQAMTGWKNAESVHAFLSGNVRKKLGLNLVSERGSGGAMTYRLEDA